MQRGERNHAAQAMDAAKRADAGVPSGSWLLEPDTLHRVDVGWSAVATRAGSPNVATAQATEHYFFRTAPHSPETPAPDRIRTATDAFHPAMLERYLAGYDPDGGDLWFTGDPVSVTFSTRGALGVARAYRYDLQLEVKRTDPPPSAPPAALPLLSLIWAETSQAKHLSPYDRHLRLLLPGCAMPPAAITGSSHDAGLLPRAAYDLRSIVVPNASAPADRTRAGLPAVAFRTSRWANPDKLFEALGFGSLTPHLLHAVVPPGAIAPAITAPSDAALLAALQVTGLRLPALAESARTTILWTTNGSPPRVVGVLLETDEPMVRGDRLGDLRLDHPGEGVVRPQHDRAATTALFWARTPFAAGSLTLRWGERRGLTVDPATSLGPEAWTIQGWRALAVPLPHALIHRLTSEVIG